MAIGYSSEPQRFEIPMKVRPVCPNRILFSVRYKKMSFVNKSGYLTKKGSFDLEIWESIHTGFHIHHFRFNIIISPFSLFFHFIFYSPLFSPYSWDSSLNFRDIYVLPLASIEEDRFDYRVVVWWNCIPFWQSRVRGYQIQIEFVSWYFYL